MGIVGKRISPFHPQCNSQAEVKNKFIAKYLGDFSDNSTLNWETLVSAMVFKYNTTIHRTIMTTSFMLAYKVEHRIPVFVTQPMYSEDFASELHRNFKLVHQLAAQHMEEKTDMYSKNHNRKLFSMCAKTVI
jgi:hypothetical protein